MKQLITSFFLAFISFSAFCQSEALIINESFKNMRMHEVFAMLKQKYDLKVAYDYESVKDVKINKTIRSKNLETALTTLFADTNLEYQLTKDNRILVRKLTTLPPKATSPKLNKYHFSGKIMDTQSNTPLAYATIYCPITNEGSSTDEAGNFSLIISSAKTEGTIMIQYLGYIPRVMSWKKGDNLSKLEINLQTKSLDFAEITILEKLPAVSVNSEDGSMTFRASQLNTLPSFVGGKDIFRSLQLLPGISASDDLSSELKIRGSNGDENMIIMDGITLYKVDHYFGIFSAINANVINQVKVFKNAFPVEYGGRTAGVIDLSSHHPVEKPKINGGLQFDLLTSSAYLSVPISDRMGLLVGGRTTNRNVANTDFFSLLQKNTSTVTVNNNENAPNNATLLKENPNFKFYDANAKWIWQINQKSVVSASFFKGYDQFDYNYERTFNTKNPRPGGKRDEVENIENFDEAAEWDNQGASLQLNHQWNKKLNTNVNLAYSKYDDSRLINSTLVRKITRRPPKDRPQEAITKIDTNFNATNSAYNSIKGTELNIKNVWDIDKKQSLTFGYHLVDNQVKFELDVDNSRPRNDDVSGKQHSSYLQYNIKQSDKFNIGLGLRSTYYTVTGKNYLSPRINLNYQATEDLEFKASCSKYHQFLRKNYREDRFGRTYDFWVLSNGNPMEYPVSSSEQCMLGFNFSKGGFVLDVEAYYKNIDGVTEFVPAQSGFASGMVNPSNQNFTFFNGTGVAKGIDVLLKKSAGKYTNWLAYTLSKTTHSFPQIDNGRAFPSQDDRRHQLKWVHQYSFKQFDFSATYIYSSGRPYTDLEKIEGSKDRDKLKPKDIISYLKDYQRIDVSASYRFNIGGTKARIGASIFNVLNRENVKYRQYIHSVPNQKGDNNRNVNEVTGTELLMLGFTPNFSFSLDF